MGFVVLADGKDREIRNSIEERGSEEERPIEYINHVSIAHQYFDFSIFS